MDFIEMLILAVQMFRADPSEKTSTDLLSLLQANEGLHTTKHVFARENQLAAVNANSNGFYALKEIIVNAMEACLEYILELVQLGTEPSSPIEAFAGVTEALRARPVNHGWAFKDDAGIPIPRVAFKKDEDGRWIVSIQDPWGMPEPVFASQYMTIHEGKKFQRDHTWGRYGQGAASIFKHSEFRVTVTRHRANPDIVLLGVVFPEATAYSKQNRQYFWHTGTDGKPLAIPADRLPDAEFGTAVYVIGLDSRGWSGASDVFKWLNAAFIATPIGIAKTEDWNSTAEDFRAKNQRIRPMFGPARSDRTAGMYEFINLDPFSLDGYDGEVCVQVAYATPGQGGSATGRTGGERNIFFTVSGLTQGQESDELINEAGLIHLKGDLIVRVELDGLKGAVSRLLRPDREGLYENGADTEELIEGVIAALKSSPELRRLEQKLAADDILQNIPLDDIWDEDDGAEENSDEGTEPGEASLQPAVAEEHKRAGTAAIDRARQSRGRTPRPAKPLVHPMTEFTFAGKKAVNVGGRPVKRIRFVSNGSGAAYKKKLIASLYMTFPKLVKVLKVRWPKSGGDGFIDIAYAGEPTVARETCGVLTAQPEPTLPVSVKQLFVKSPLIKSEGKKGKRPPVAAQYFVSTLSHASNTVLREWGIDPEKVRRDLPPTVKPYQECARLGGGSYPPVSTYNGGKLQLEIDLSTLIDGKLPPNSEAFKAYRKSVAQGHATEKIEHSAQCKGLLQNNGDTSSKLRAAWALHNTALSGAKELDKVKGSAAGR